MDACVFRGRKRILEPTLTSERWFLSVYYPKADTCTLTALRSVRTLVKECFDVQLPGGRRGIRSHRTIIDIMLFRYVLCRLCRSGDFRGQGISEDTILNSSDVLNDRYSPLRRGMAVARKSSAAKFLLDPPAAMAIVSS